MRTRMLLTFTLIALTGFAAKGQGYFLFTATKNSVWDEFTTGVPMSGGGHTIAGFIWGPAGTTNAWLGSVGTRYDLNPGNPFKLSMAFNDPSWHLATNAAFDTFVSVNVNASGLAIGGINYNSSATFQVAGTTGGQTYTIYCIAWDNKFSNPLEAFNVGWSNPFQYTAGNGPTSTPLGFSSSGMQPFGVGIPEPTTFALAGLGALLLIRHRRHSRIQSVPT